MENRDKFSNKIYLHQNCSEYNIMENEKCEEYPNIENDSCHIVTNRHTHSQYCEHIYDRRSRLCNYILDENCPACQLPVHSAESSRNYSVFRRKVPIKSRYMDFYYKNQEGTRPAQKYYDVPEANQSYSANEKCKHDESLPSQKTSGASVVKSRSCLKNIESLRQGPVKVSRLDWKDYHRLHTIHKFLDDMQYNYPSICTTGVIGLSLEQRDLKVLKVSNSNCGNASVWIDGGIHAREWIAPAVNTYLINSIVEKFDDLPNSMANKDWYFLPVMNPDGYEFSHTHYRMWRKNKACIGNECVGVDLNRNFSYGWGGRNSSGEPRSAYYRGPHPFSEPESRAVRDMIKSSGIKFKVYITLHSYGEVIMFPFAYRDELCPDYIRLLEGATKMSKNPFLKIFKVATCPPRPSQLWEVRFKNNRQRCFVRSLDTCGAINIWREERSTMDFFVDGSRVAQVAGMLHDNGIPYSISVRDVDELKRREQGSACTINISRCMNWKSYHSLSTVYGFMDKLAQNYPYLCSVCCIGKTCEGRDIKLLKISNGNPDNKGVWLDGAIHGREWITVAVVTFVANELVKNFHKQPECITNKDWYILPVLNPDGYVYSHTRDRMWRKNRTKFGECFGVDLNRNFSCGWGETGEEGSSDDPGSIFYRGPQAFSERETAAVRKTILEADTDFKVFISFHSYGEVIIFPWGYTGDPCPAYVELLEGGTAMARAIHANRGTTYRVGSTKDLMYFAAGTSIDWSYGVAKIPYSYMVELPSKEHRFLLPKERIIDVSTEVYCGLRELMSFVDKRCKRTGPSRTCLPCDSE